MAQGEKSWVGAKFCAAFPMADPIAIYRQQQAALRAKAGEGVEVEILVERFDIEPNSNLTLIFHPNDQTL